MSPILSFSGERRPPPFRDTSATSYRRPSTDHGACDDLDAEDESDASPPSYPPPGPSSSPPPLAKHTKLKRSRTGSGDERYGQREEEDAREEEEGLLYELDRLDASGVTLPESAAERTARGARALGVGTGVGFCGIERPTQAAWREIRELMLETMPTLLLTLLGLVFTGELLEHLSHWRVFERVDELFILTPMLANLKGNLEMCLGARLSTSANIGELDVRKTRKDLILGQLSLLQLQALVVSFLAALLSFLLGLTTPHRVSNDPIDAALNATLSRYNLSSVTEPRNLALAAGMFLGQRDDPDLGYIDSFKEGYTPPGFRILALIVVTSMLAASLSGALLGSFMSALVVLSRRMRINPDNIATPIASCLSDLVTLFILGCLGSLFLPFLTTDIPLFLLPILTLAGAGFMWSTLRNDYVKGLISGGWTPLLAAMTISSLTGVVLERCVSRYEGYAILAVAMTGLSGAVGSVHASRLSTILHTSFPPSQDPASGALFPSPPPPPLHERPLPSAASPRTMALALFAVTLPVQAFFLVFVAIAGWMRMEWQLVVCFVVVFCLTVAASIALADRLTTLFWSRGLDPDSYTLPIHSSLIDLIGQVLLVLAFEAAALLGGDVRVVLPLVAGRSP